MPKVLLTANSRHEAELAKKNNGITYAIAGAMKVRGMTMSELGKATNMSCPTVSRRIRCPETLTVQELRDIGRVLGNMDELARCI